LQNPAKIPCFADNCSSIELFSVEIFKGTFHWVGVAPLYISLYNLARGLQGMRVILEHVSGIAEGNLKRAVTKEYHETTED
jgi:hypothetical protein